MCVFEASCTSAVPVCFQRLSQGRLVTAAAAGAGGNAGGVALLEAGLCHAEEGSTAGTGAAASNERTQETEGDDEES